MDDELDLEELEQVGTVGFEKLNNVVTAFENNDYETVVKNGSELLASPMFNEHQKEEIQRMISQSEKIIQNSKQDSSFLGL